MPSHLNATYPERLDYWLETYADTSDSTLDALGLTPRAYRRQVSDPLTKPNVGLLVRLGRVYPTCNLEWLLTGQGEPCWTTPPDPDTKNPVFPDRLALVERYQFLKESLPLLSDVAKSTLLAETLELVDRLHEGNERLMFSLEEMNRIINQADDIL